MSCLAFTADLAARLAARTDRSGGPTACWPWLGASTSAGYGVIGVGGRQTTAHRAALELALGRPLGPGMVARHLVCDNPPCVNPAHLAEGTQGDNVGDMLAKGREARGDRNGSRRHPERLNPARGERNGWHTHPERMRPARGERNGRAKLTAAQAAEIRRRALGGETQAVLAAEFGVSTRLVWLIKAGRIWEGASA